MSGHRHGPWCGCGAAHAGWSRRGFLGTGIAAAAAIGTGIGEIALPRTAQAQAQGPMTPDAALKELADGNRRFLEQKMNSFNEDLQILKERTAAGQTPFAALLACADSRMPVELIFDQSIGELFVTRVAGNVVSPDLIASLEYGVAVLGVKAIMVLGHASCGAVEAAIEAKPVPGQISVLYRPLRQAVEQAGPNLEAAIKKNAQIQAGLLRDTSTVVAEAVKGGKLKVVAGYYDLASGVVTML